MHIPLIHGEDGSKLSKRHGAKNVLDFRNNGYLQESIINNLIFYLAGRQEKAMNS